MTAEQLRRFRRAYAEHRAAEGRGAGGETELRQLPYLSSGPLRRQWAVRARTFRRFVRVVIDPLSRQSLSLPLRILDLGAGNGWLCYRLALRGHRTAALDLRTDAVDGLAAAALYRQALPNLFLRMAASFEDIPCLTGCFDVAVFNAALHYALDLRGALAEAARVVRPGGRVAILDSPFYTAAEDGEAMNAEKRVRSAIEFGERADDLLGLPFVDYLTRERLRASSEGLGLSWRRYRVRYPWWYELRPLLATLSRKRRPSRFDLWAATVERGR